MSCHFDRIRKLFLVVKRDTSDTSWNNLTPLCDKLSKRVDIFVVDMLHARCSEGALFTLLTKRALRHRRWRRWSSLKCLLHILLLNELFKFDLFHHFFRTQREKADEIFV